MEGREGGREEGGREGKTYLAQACCKGEEKKAKDHGKRGAASSSYSCSS